MKDGKPVYLVEVQTDLILVDRIIKNYLKPVLEKIIVEKVGDKISVTNLLLLIIIITLFFKH